MNKQENAWLLETKAIRSGVIRSHYKEHSEAIYPTSSFVYDSAEEARSVFAGDTQGYAYSRYTNPSVEMFEKRMAVLEGGELACATGSGMAAILGICMSQLRAGDHVLCSRSVFGTTISLFSKYMDRFGVETTFIDFLNYDQWRDSIRPETKLLFVETPSNPLGQVVDIEMLASIAHGNNALLVVDNCFCSPVLQQPLALGADIVMHSATKYLDGQGRCMGGVAVGSNAIIEEMALWQRSAGACLSPFNAWVIFKGLETLSLRMKAHCSNAMILAQWLCEQPSVLEVHYSGLSSHPNHELAKKQQQDFGGVLAFEVKGERKEAWQVIDAVQIMSRTANLGDARTTITHPATTTHCRLSIEDKQRVGIKDSLIRVAVGLENVEDLKKDLLRGLSLL